MPVASPRLHRPGGGVGVNGVALAEPPAGRPVGAVDLQDPLTRGGQEADEPGAVAARALHPPGLDLTQPTGPGQQLAIASPAGRGDGDAKPAAQLVPRCGHVDVLVRSTPTVTRAGSRCAMVVLPSFLLRRVVAPAGRADNTATSLVATGSYQVTPSGRCRSRRPWRRADRS